MALFQPYKGTGSPPSIVEDGNIYFNLTDKTILVDHNDQRYTFFGTDTNSITSVNNKTGAVNLTASDVGAATNNHNHDSTYLKLSGGTVTGEIKRQISPVKLVNSDNNISSNIWCYPFRTEDVDGRFISTFESTITTDGWTHANLLACSRDANDTQKIGVLGVAVHKDGSIMYNVTNAAAFRNTISAQVAGNYAASSHNHDAGNITSGRLGRDRMPYWTNEVIWTSASHSTTYGASGYATFTTSAGASNAIYAVVTCILDATNSSLGYVDLIFPRQNQTNGYAWFGDDNYVSGRWYGVYNGAYYSRKFGRLALNEGGGYGDMNLWSNGYKNTTGGNQYLCPVRISIVY